MKKALLFKRRAYTYLTKCIALRLDYSLWYGFVLSACSSQPSRTHTPWLQLSFTLCFTLSSLSFRVRFRPVRLLIAAVTDSHTLASTFVHFVFYTKLTQFPGTVSSCPPAHRSRHGLTHLGQALSRQVHRTMARL